MIDMVILDDAALSYDAANAGLAIPAAVLGLQPINCAQRNIGLALTAVNFGGFKARR